jgi:hypothetical protein
VGLFGGIDKAQGNFGGNYIRTGTHTLEVMRIKIGNTRKGVAFMAVDFEVLETSNPEHVVGSTVNWFNGADKDGFLSNAKSLAVALLGSAAGEAVDESTVTEETMEGLCGNDGEDVKGVKIKADAFLVDTKKGGKYTKILWEPIVG